MYLIPQKEVYQCRCEYFMQIYVKASGGFRYRYEKMKNVSLFK